MEYPGAANGGRESRDRPQRAAWGLLKIPESVVFALLWVLVAVSLIGPWGLLLWWLSEALVWR
jgi:nitrate reductase NapE component